MTEDDQMIDQYTKAVLTVIAAALVGLVLQNLISSGGWRRPACFYYVD